jgi:hypothetical protein
MGSSCEYSSLNDFPSSERYALLVHKWFLSERAGHDVGEALAIHDWLKHYAASWRKHRLEAELKEQRREMEKHRWIESEKACRDLGSEAYRDWILRYAAAWREWYRSNDPVRISR